MDRDIVKSFARLRMMIHSMREKFAASMEEMKEKREEEKAKEIGRTAIQMEREKILKSRTGKGLPEEEHELKDTNINRPVGNELVKEAKTKESVEKISTGKELEIEKVITPIPVDEEIEEIVGETFDKIKQTSGKNIKKTVDSNGEASGEKSTDENFPVELLENFRQPSLDLLEEPLKEELDVISDEELKENGRLLQAKLLNFGVKIEKVIATPGPVVPLYE